MNKPEPFARTFSVAACYDKWTLQRTDKEPELAFTHRRSMRSTNMKSFISPFWRCMAFLRDSLLHQNLLNFLWLGLGAWCGANCGDFLAVSMRLSSPPELWTLLWIVLLFNAMGCIQSIRCKPKSFRDSIIVLEVKTGIDNNPTSIDESSSVVLRYRTPHFRAHAHVLVPPVAGQETWTIGWIQACNHMEFYNTYGNKGMWVSGVLMALFKCILLHYLT